MKNFLFIVLLLVGGLLQQAQAQSRTLTGKVTDQSTGSGLPGVTVLVKGTTVGTSSNAEGNFSLTGVPADASTIVFSFVGYASQERAVGSDSNFSVGLAVDTKQLSEVVVTALGREESKRSLGYAVQDIKGEEFTQARETNVVNSLAGRMAGVQISNSTGAVGSSSRIVIRGAKSATGNNQPLFVIDGQPIDNSSFSNSGSGGGIDYGNGVSDINPDDIETMTVLKGANAAALYGSRGNNGVVIITTKSGRKARGLGISLNSTTSFESVLTSPDFQDEYGQGSGGTFSYVDGAGGGDNDGTDESWGPRLDGRLIRQYNSPVNGVGVRSATPWVSPGKDNIREHFFETGRTLTNSVAVSGGNEKAGVRVSFTNLDSKGILYNTFLRRNTVNVNGGADITSKFKVSTNISYTETRGRRPGQGYDELNVMQQLFTWYGRQVDVRDLRSIYESGQRNNNNWNSNYHNNPYFVLGEATNDDQRDRIIGNLTLNYALTDWLNLTARTTNDIYNQFNQRRVPAETISNGVQDDYTEERIRVLERNTEFLATANRNLTEDFNLDVLLGANRRDSEIDQSQIAAPNLAVPGLFTLGNSSSPLVTGNNFGSSNSNNNAILNPETNLRVNSVYGSARVGYKNFAFLGATLRNDWFSTLPAANRSFNYPSVDASVVLTDAFGITESFLSYAKVRGGYAEVGNGAPAYRTQNIFTGSTPFGGNPVQTVFNTLYNPDLKPERTNSIEAGVELRFLKNRIGLEVTGYSTSTIDQIINIPVSASTGYNFKTLNAGEITNKGIETVLTLSPLPAESAFQWNVTANFAANRNEVVKFDEEGQIRNLLIGGSGFGVNIEARVGEAYGAIFSDGFLRVPDGEFAGQLVNGTDGTPLVDPTRRILGNYTPDWIGGITNRVSYKGIDLSFTIDTRQGGEMQSETIMWGTYAGALTSTLPGREEGIVAPGVQRSGTPGNYVYTPNTIRATAEDYYKGLAYTSRENSVVDASFVKLREVRLGYQLPKSLTEGTFVKGVGVSFVGRNLWLISSDAQGLDPETSFNNGNTQGLESTQIPSVKSLGFNINVTL